MKTTDFNNEVNSKAIAEKIEKLFDVNVDLTKYTREQLEDYRNKLRTRVFQYEGGSKMNDLLTNEEYQKDKAMLELLNTRIKEMLGEQMKKLINQMDQLSEAKAKPDYIDLDGDGNKKEPMKKAAKDAKVKEGAKPDFLDLDKDGNKKEPMKKAAKDAKVKEAKVDEKAVSKAQQQAAGVALAAKKAGKKPAGKGAAAQMAKMPKGELEKFAGTKHKGLPKKKDKKADEDVNEFFSFPKGKDPDSQRAANKPQDKLSRRGGRDTPVVSPAAYKDMVRGKGTHGKRAKDMYGINGPKGTLPEEHKPLLPKQKAVADKVWDAERAAGKASKAAKRQAGTKSPVSETFRKNVAVVNESLARLINEDEEGKAKAITAASDMVNDFTSWMQRVGQYQTKSMIELADSIRANFGQQESEIFKQSVAPALAATLETLTQQREAISNAVAVLAGEAAPEVPMGPEPTEPGVDAAAPDELNTADELDAFAASDAAAGAGTTGREIRESREERVACAIAEQHNIIARLTK